MKFILIIIFLVLAVTFLYPLYNLRKGIRVAESLVGHIKPYQNITNDTSKTLLVFGDSTGVGVGAASEQSIAALLAQDIQATFVENKAISGARVEDLAGQRTNLLQERYGTILIQIGGNNVVARHDAQVTAEKLAAFLKTLPAHDTLYVLMCGDVGTAPLIPWYLRSYYSHKNKEFHQVFEQTVTAAGGSYINLFIQKEEDPFLKEPERYFAVDGFHPSAAGYEVWYKKLSSQIK